MHSIKFYSPSLTGHECDSAANTIKSKWVANGPQVRAFEAKIAEMSGCQRAVAVDSCTAAMELALRVLGVGEGDEVITTPYTYSATAEVIRNVGATIVFVDLDGESFEMDYEQVAKAITDKTKAVIPVDIGGKMCNYEKLKMILEDAKKKFIASSDLQKVIGRIAIIADAAHSFGATMDGIPCGAAADFTCFSFHVVKPVTTGGEGGACVWNDFRKIDNDLIEQTMRLLADHGQTSRNKGNGWEYDIQLFGYNSIMTDVDAGVGLSQLMRYDHIVKQREDVTRRYDELFQHIKEATPLIRHFGPEHTSAMHLYPIRLNDKWGTAKSRNLIFGILAENGVQCNVHYKPLPMMTAYKNIGFSITDYPNAYNMFKSLITIPYYADLTEKEQEYVVENIVKAVRAV